ncbi:MAG: TetR/AcrR family transcriptional regulator [Pseudomonadota bacterium]
MTDPETRTPPGRPRSDRTRTAILDATLQLVEERPPGEVTIKAIAEASGAGRQTLYRWWRNRGEIVVEALRESGRQHVRVGAFRALDDGVQQFLRATVTRARALRRALAIVMIDAQSDSDFLELFREQFVEIRRAALFEVFESDDRFRRLSAEKRAFLADTAFGPLWYRLLVQHAALDKRFADELSALVVSCFESLVTEQKS